MGTHASRGSGTAREIGGKIQKGVGRAVGDTEMEAKGAGKEASGRVEKEAAKAGQRAKGKVDEVAGKVRQKLNK